MTKKAENKPDQIRAFRKAARDLGVDESEANFDAALKTVARHKPADIGPSSKSAKKGDR